MIASIRIVVLAAVSAILYGVVHDQITARLCIQYFTLGHHPIWKYTHSPTLLGLAWGVITTWRAGLMIGIALSVVSQAGRSYRKIGWVELIKPIAVLMAVMAIGAFITGAVVYKQAVRGIIGLQGDLAWQVPFEAQNRFIACTGSHMASYVLGFVGGLALCGYVGVVRLRSPRWR